MEEPIQTPSRKDTAQTDSLPLLQTLHRIKMAIMYAFSALFMIVILLVGFWLYLRIQPLPPMTFNPSTMIYDIHGELIDSSQNGENRHVIVMDEIAPTMMQAAIAIEDKRYYQHWGIDPLGLARALWINIRNRDLEQGASTITQQLARNLFLSHEKTWSRKMREALYALQLETAFTKDEILVMYLNQIYFGHGAYGIQAASQLYFGKDAVDLTLAESALMAAVMKSWKYYSPHMDLEQATSRQRLILGEMAAQGVISSQQAIAAGREPLEILPLSTQQVSVAPYFRDYVRTVAVGELGIDEELYASGGLKIYTTLDLHAQQMAEEMIAKYVNPYDELQVALVSIDPRNGHIQAMVGGRNYLENQYNRALADRRQPGSSFKPIVYLTALQQEGFTAVTRFKSEPTTFSYDEGRQNYTPQNFANKYANQWVDLRYALARSDNIYAVHTILQVGADKVVDMARQLGITSELQPLPSLALGSFSVSPFEMASAFATIANGGLRIQPIAIMRIEDPSGRVLYEVEPVVSQVVDARYTYVLTHLMQSVFGVGGTAHRVADLIKRPVAGKTGTTNSDAWMVGFTPELATAVWVGHDQGRAIATLEAHTAAPIFAEYTERVLASVPPKLFMIPEGVTTLYIDPESGLLATEDCPNPRLESFVAGTEPTESCSKHTNTPVLPIPDEESGSQRRNWWEDLKRWWNS